mgnify:CR=1 FL=1
MIKYAVNSSFINLKDFSLSLPDTFNHIGKVIQDHRNVIKKITNEHGSFVVKDYKGMYFFNRLGYSLFSLSKAQKSYRNSEFLNKHGIKTPQHIAWIDCYNYGLLQRSFFVSALQPFETFKQFLARTPIGHPQRNLLYDNFLAFIIKLHTIGIYHDDFSITNVLVIPSENGFEFSLVDLNRMSYRKSPFRKSLQNFNKLEIPTEELYNLISGYAKNQGQSAEEAIKMFLADSAKAQAFRRNRRALRRYTLTPLENLVRKLRNKEPKK